MTRLREHLESAEDDVRQSLRNVAVVRYDAFGDMGGRLSFSAAIVDDLGDGIVHQLDPRPRRVAHLRQGHRRR